MRWQLLLGFALIIGVVVGSSWYLGVRATDAQFAILVSEANQQQARLIAPTLLEEYGKAGDWETVQANLTSQIDQQTQFNTAQAAPITQVEPIPEGAFTVVPLQAQVPLAQLVPAEPAHNQGWDLQVQGNVAEGINFTLTMPYDFALNLPAISAVPAEDRYFMIRAGVPQTQTIFVEPASITWTAGNFILSDQRAIVIDPQNTVVVDSEQSLLGKQANEGYAESGVPLYTSSGKIGTLVITSRKGVYSVKQHSFLAEVRQGILVSGLFSGAVALVVALGIAYQITRPIRSLTAATTRLQQGEWGYQVNFQARNEIGQLAAAFNEMSRHLAEQRSLRTRLVDDLAHELNTPLSLMRLELQAMADGLQTPAEAAAHLNQELSEVTDLVSDLVFLANRDAAPAPTMEWLDLNDLVEATVKRFQNAAQHHLAFMPQAQLPSIYGDAYLVGRAVSNLISNGIRHTPTGGKITVATRLNGAMVEVYVQDTGEGIAPDHLPHIFDRFYRADSSRTRHSGGRGLGLAIVKQIMEQHGGDVKVESEVGKGSLFKLQWKMT